MYGAFLLAIYDDEACMYQTISKIGTGFSEEQLVDLHGELTPHIITQPKPYYM